MSQRSYPFRFYGREPADWSNTDLGYVYEVQFARALSPEQKQRLADLYERQFRDGPAAAQAAPWWWAGDRFAIFAVTDRHTDAPRMVFSAVAQFLVDAHAVARVRDVVFSNGYGARADRWDAWSLAAQPVVDPGPARPPGELDRVLRRSEDPSLGRYEVDDAFEAARRGVAAPARARAPQTPEPAAPAAPAAAKRAKVAPAAITFEPVDPADYPAPEPWAPASFHKVKKAKGDRLIPGLRVPLAHVMDGVARGIASVDAEFARHESTFPTGVAPGAVAVDPDGLHAIVASGQTLYEVALPGGDPKWRLAIHANNGAISGVAWAVDDLWAVLSAQQLMLFDLKDVEQCYVGCARVYNGTRVSGARHGTVLVVDTPGGAELYGVTAWQLRRLATLAGARFAHEFQGELLLWHGASLVRAAGLDAALEAWAAPLRNTEESARRKRFVSSRSKRPATKPRWRYVEPTALPPDAERAARDRLREIYGAQSWVAPTDAGNAMIVRGVPGQTASRAATLTWRTRDGAEVDLAEAAPFLLAQGVTNFSITPDDAHVLVVDGRSFGVHRIDLAKRRTVQCTMPAFMRPNGLLVNVVAPGADDLIALWVDGIDWHRRDGTVWRLAHRAKVAGVRAVAFDAAQRRMLVPTESTPRLVVMALEDGSLAVEAKFADSVKEATFREGRVFAQMTDGSWFELEGLPQR